MNFKDFIKEHKKAVLVILVAIIVSPLFALAADAVGYSEPLEKSADHLGAEESPIYGGILPDYSVPGVDSPIGTFIAGLVGSIVTLIIMLGVTMAIKGRNN
ncbi:MAG: cobalt transport protein CbiN [Candidatus Methanofastidiosum methylothiophilum]|uniref:Cobalt transport protein CbiN n=1 Tax=Candidatus Methanofastidiosum methylothiophilum TaxID=1705564 RepID=A0A150IYR4_9EURY|nr:MAG: cobalt transport protein CbiN [Candidatus Methanofastidiosum methylthiophilus]KYC47439.1 MAG: cobalt transport protein CbiN [Candidatus Methanofastidiosum methylthiophilus]KYC49998.1 MAG: cobalt transport protein CbiN [Candidatus Methanofastidiosum methylthiophilus]